MKKLTKKQAIQAAAIITALATTNCINVYGNEIKGDNLTLSNVKNSGDMTVEGNNITIKESAQNSGKFTLRGDNNNIKGLTQSENSASLTLGGENITLTEGNITNGNFTLEEGSELNFKGGSIAGAVNAKVSGDLNISGGEVTLNSGDTIEGTVALQESGNLTLDGISTDENWDVNAEKGKLTVKGNVTLDGGDAIGNKEGSSDELTFKIEDNGTNLTVKNAEVTLDSNDTWSGTVTLNEGEGTDNAELHLNGVTSNGKLDAKKGTINSKDSTLNLGSGSSIDGDVDVTLNGGSLTLSNGGKATFGENDTVSSDTKIESSGDLTLEGAEFSGKLQAKDGTLKIGGDNGKNQDLTLGEGSSIDENANVTVNGGNITVNDGASASFGDGDNLTKGNLKLSGGDITLDGNSTNENFSLQATSGNLTLDEVTFNNSNDKIGEDIHLTVTNGMDIEKGDIIIDGDDSIEGTVTVEGGSLTLDSASTDENWNVHGNSGNLKVKGNVTLDGGDIIGSNGNSPDSLNVEIENEGGNLTVKNAQVTLDSNDTWSGTVTLDEGEGTDSAELHLNGVTSNGKLDAKKGTLTSKDSTLTLESGSNIEEGVDVTLEGGSLTLSNGGSATFGENDTVSSDTTIVSGGDLTLEGAEFSGKLQATSGNLNIGGDNGKKQDLTLEDGSEIKDGANVDIKGGSTVDVQSGGKVSFNNGDKFTEGKLKLSGGDASFDGNSTNEKFSLEANSGKLTLKDTTLNNSGDKVEKNVELTIEDGMDIQNGNVTIDDSDSIEGTVEVNGGSLTLDGASTDETWEVDANTGNLTVKGNVTLDGGDSIGNKGEGSDGLTFKIEDDGTNLTVKNAEVTLDSGDTWEGKITLEQDEGSANAELNLNGVTKNGTLDAKKGTINSKNSTLNLGSGSSIDGDVDVTLEGGSLTLSDGGSATFGENDTVSSDTTIESSGDLTLEGAEFSGKLQATDGTLKIGGGDGKSQDLTLGEGSSIDENATVTVNGGNITVNDKASVSFSDSDTLTKGTLNLSGGSASLKGNSTNSNFNLNAESGTLTLDEVTFNNSKDKISESIDLTVTNGMDIEDGDITINSGDSIEGTVEVNGGSLTLDSVTTDDTWDVDATKGNLTVKGETTLGGGDTIGSKDDELTVTVDEGGNLTLKDADLYLDESDVWKGKITLDEEDGSSLSGLHLDGVDIESGKLDAKKGHLDVSNASWTLKDGDTLDEKVDANLNNVELTIDGGSATLNGSEGEGKDTITGGKITLENGSLNMKDLSTKDTELHAKGGELTLEKVELDNDNDEILFGTKADIKGDLEIKKGKVELDSKDVLESGKVTLNGENATLGVDGITTGGDTEGKYGVSLELQQGTLNIEGEGLTLANEDDVIQKEITTNVKGNLNLEDGKVFLNEGDSWTQGTIHVSDKGELQFEDFTKNAGSPLLMDGENSLVELKNSNVTISDASNIQKGKINIDNNSNLNIQSEGMGLGEMNTSGTLSSMNGGYEEHKIGTLNVAGTYDTMSGESETKSYSGDNQADFKVDFYARNYDRNKSDKFSGDELSFSGEEGQKGTINVSDWTLNGNLKRGDTPLDRSYTFNLFDYKEVDDNIEFASTNKEQFTANGWYKLKANGDNTYTLELSRLNKQQFRGQVATLAQFNNQLTINDIVTNHIILQNERKLADMGQNRYAAATPTLGPYLYTQQEGGLWMKGYGDIEKIHMTNDLNINSISYGSIIGADFPLINLKNDWKFIPTPYIGYNGAHQSFSDVSSYQNGGQLGFMGTFMKDNFISSHTLYGGGYYNEMHVDGVKDELGNWFWGTAHRFAYNWDIKRHFIIQPTALISYNMFGNQNWHSVFGEESMRTGMLNGINVAPGLNLIYLKNDWSIYLSAQYLWNINEQVSGRAGNIDYPNLKMRHGYIQYGLGATKNIKEDLSAYGQVMLRNGGRTGIGFQVGLQYFFDIREIGDKISSAIDNTKNKISNSKKANKEKKQEKLEGKSKVKPEINK